MKKAIVAFSLVASCARAPRQTPAPSVDDTRLVAAINAVMDSSMAVEHIPGAAVVLVRDGRVVMSKGFGFANLETRVPVDPATTRFRIGSISKAVTSLAVLQLVDRGRIRLDDPVSRLIPDLPIDNRFAEPVRVWHLVTHSAGFDQMGDSARVTFDASKRVSIEQFLRGNLRVIRAPGRGSSYDTWGMTLAGLIVERVSRVPYAEYMRRELFLPLGMRNTDVETPDSVRAKLAIGYSFIGGNQAAEPYEYYATTPASSIDATPDDMGRLMLALLGNGTTALSRPALARFQAVQFSNYPGIPAYTFGMFESEVNGERVIGHGGDMREFESDLTLVPSRRLGLYVVYNHNGEAGGQGTRLRETLKRRVLREVIPEAPRAAAPVSVAVDTKRFEGAYATAMYCHTCVEGRGWNFSYYAIRSVGPGVLSVDGNRWVAVGPTLFVDERTGRSKLGFLENARGEITHGVAGNDVRERMGEWLLDDVFGAGWRAAPLPTLAARMYRTSAQWDRCATAYVSLAEAASGQPQNGRNWYYAGYCALQRGDAALAIRASAKAWELAQWPRPTSYQLAASYAKARSADDAFTWLKRSAELGFLTRRMLDGDSAFTPLRTDPRYAELRAALP